MNKVYFVTGATGFVGQEILRRLAGDPSVKAYCFIRRSKTGSVTDRFREIMNDIGQVPAADIRPLEGDLRKERMGLDKETFDALTREITHIVHSAADVRFNQDLETIRNINVGGTRRILELTAACKSSNPAFSHLDYVSTAFVAGRRPMVAVENALLNGYGFKNTYEQTKFEAEDVVRAAQATLPIIIYRPSIVLGFSEDGKAKPRNVIYPMLKLFTRWKYPVVPALAATRLDLVPVDFVASALLHISQDPKNFGKCFHLAAGPDGDLSLGRFVKIMGDEFEKRVILIPPWSHRKVVRPLLKRFRPDFYEKSTQVFRAFEPYIWEKNPRYSVEQTRAALEGSNISLPDSERFLRACLRFAIKTDFGTRA